MAVYDQGPAPVGGAARAGVFVQYAGAAVSLALIAGVGIWGYKLVMRDVTGIPVVRAMAGEMRVLPDNPGGEVSTHAGLSVNAVAALGEAAAPEDTVALAPTTAGLAAEDLEAQPTAEAGEVLAVDPAPTTVVEAETQVALNGDQLLGAPLTKNDILALADQIASGAAPLTDLADGQDVAPTLELAGQSVTSTSVAAVSVSLRPIARKAKAPAAAAPQIAPAAAVEVTRTQFEAGTKLVQLGAYPSADVAGREWTRLSGKFGELMDGKSRVIQTATSGGKTFYRLRAQGFGELNDARRFCAALIAENADCIPVVVR